jgi:hypothetical protein
MSEAKSLFSKEEINLIYSLWEDKAWDPLQDAWEEMLLQKGYKPLLCHKDAVYFVYNLRFDNLMGTNLKRFIDGWIRETSAEIEYKTFNYVDVVIPNNILEEMNK